MCGDPQTPRCRVHAVLPGSRTNGPGRRNVLWFQGCRRRCPGCFNPETHPHAGGEWTTAEALAGRLLVGDPDGVSLSGGEPFEQPEGLLALLRALRRRAPTLSLLAFTGSTLAELRALPLGPAALRHLDLLVAGPYVQARHRGHPLLGSANQQIHLLSDRHRPEELAEGPTAEVVLHHDGTVTVTGWRSSVGARLRRSR